jgi:hypothetical protein
VLSEVSLSAILTDSLNRLFGDEPKTFPQPDGVNNVLGNRSEFAHAFGGRAGQAMVQAKACPVC